MSMISCAHFGGSRAWSRSTKHGLQLRMLFSVAHSPFSASSKYHGIVAAHLPAAQLRLLAPPHRTFKTTRPALLPSHSPTASDPPPNAEGLFDWAALEREKREVWGADPGTVAALRSDHAGETGAVWIYRGAAWALARRSGGTPAARRFVAEHLATEAGHLALMERLLEEGQRSRLLPLWRAAGFGLGALPALVSEAALFCTVEAVETFVEEHYLEHLLPLEAGGRCPELCRLLRRCCEEEVHHRDDA
ncbi:unnamed protein product, partial [Heterosigma akashiwo]